MDENCELVNKDIHHADVADPKKDQLECEVCYKPFVYERSLLKHLATQHASPTSHGCHICGDTFDNNSSLQRHSTTHLNMRKFQCDFCIASFKTLADLQLHKKIHSDLDKVGCRCTICDKVFARKDILLNHMKIHNPEAQERVPCKICGVHITKVSYRRHIQRHFKCNKYPCSVCQKRFPSIAELNLHYNIHTGDARYECEICDFRAYFKYILNAHMRKHTPEKHVHACNKCQKVYSRSDSLKRHLKLHDNRKPYRCSRCQRAYTSSFWCRVHEKTHSVTEKIHQCNHCQRSFLTIQHLNIHMACHKKPFVCGICSHSFHSKHDLTRHMNIHLNGNFCQICNKTHRHLAKHVAKHERQAKYKCQECNFVSCHLKTYKDACKHIQEKLPRCQLCRRIFLTENGLNLHVKRYQNYDLKCYHSTKQRPIAAKKINKPKPKNKCQECNREFNDTLSYKQHMESHDPNKQFCCEYCHERFYSFTKLYKHLGKHNG